MAQYTVTIEPVAEAGCGGCLSSIYAAGYLLTLGLWFIGSNDPSGGDFLTALIVTLFWPLMWVYFILAG